MTVDSNYMTVIATLSDWLKIIAPVFSPIGSKTKTNCNLYARFLPPLSKLHATARNSDWFMVLFAPGVIGRSNDSHLKTVLK